MAAPVISIETDTLRFGYISVGGNHVRQLDISNTGTDPLIVNTVMVHDTAFTLLSPAIPDTIPPGQHHDYRFHFGPAAINSFDGTFSFYSNDPVRPTAALPVRASGTLVYMPGEIIWSYQGPENVVSCTAVEDIDDDGIQDVVAEVFDAGVTGDHLFCVSGSGNGEGSLIWSSRPAGGPSNSGGYGDDCLIAIDDMNGNGTRDLILGTAWGGRTIFAIEGSTGQAIWSYDTYQNLPSGWVYSVCSMGDLNGDSIPEVLAGAGSDANAGILLNGADGALIWRHEVVDAVYSVSRVDDINNDGVPEAVLGAGDNDDKVYFLSGAIIDTMRIWTYDANASVMSVGSLPDANGDAYADIIAGTWGNGNLVLALSGYSRDRFGDTLWATPAGNVVMKIVISPDLNNDWFSEVLVASWASYAQALSGHNGDMLWSFPMGDDVWAIYWAYDMTGDGVNEAVAGSFTGAVSVINGVSGEQVWTCNTDAKIFTVRPIGDVNGDGTPDIIAGQQFLSNVGGKFFVISGGTVGTSGIDDGNGTTLPENHMLLTNYPNPFNAQTVISYELPRAATVRLELFNLLGQKVDVLYEGRQEAGQYKVTYDAGNSHLSSGVYYCRLSADDDASTIKMTILK
jgi:outer membrane protein assembly factor BamB